MGKNFDIKRQDIETDKLSVAKDMAELQEKLKAQQEALKPLMQKKTLDEANKFLDDVSLKADDTKLTLQVGDIYVVAKDETEYNAFLKTISADVAKANGELEKTYTAREAEVKKATEEAKKKSEDLKDDVNKNDGKFEKDAQGRLIFASKEDLQKFMDKHTAKKTDGTNDENEANDEKPEENNHYTRKEKKIMRLNEKMTRAHSERRKMNLSDRIKNVSDRKNKLEQRTRDNMQDAGVNTVNAHEAKNQVWFYNDMIAGITKRDGRVHYDGENLIIATYNPLFIGADNLPGEISIRMTPEEMQQRDSGLDEASRKQHPDFYDNKGETKGLFTVAQEGLVKAGMSPKTAEGWRGVLKMASYVGLGVGLWKYGKKVFGVFSSDKEKRSEGWKWLLGGAGLTILSQTYMHENPVSLAFKVLNGGLTPEQIKKIPGAESFVNIFKKYPHLKESVQYPAATSFLFPGKSFGEIMKEGNVVRWSNETVTVDRKKLIAYYDRKLSEKGLSANMKQLYVNAKSEIERSSDEQLNVIMNGGMKGAGINSEADAQGADDYNAKWQEYAKKKAESLKSIESPVINSMVAETAAEDVKSLFEKNQKKLLTKEQGNDLENALDKVKEKDSSAKIDFSKEHGIILHTIYGEIPISLMSDGKWQVAGFEKSTFDNADQALAVGAVTLLIINKLSGKQTREKSFTVSARGDLMFNEKEFFGKTTGIVGTEVLDGADWQKLPGDNSTILAIGGSTFESHIEAYRDYLNGLTNTNGKSIWKAEGQIATTSSIAEFMPTWQQVTVEAPKPPVSAPDNQPKDETKSPDEVKPEDNKADDKPGADKKEEPPIKTPTPKEMNTR